MSNLYRIPVYAILLFTSGLVLYAHNQEPSLLYRVTREDGPIENATVLAMLFLAAMIPWRLKRPSQAELPPMYRLAAWALAFLALLGAGEEVSWGQRIFGFETGETMSRINLQKETNLHNLIPGELFNGLIIFTVGILLVLIPFVMRRRAEPPAWLPSKELSLLTVSAILINHYQFRSLPEKVGIVVLLLFLFLGTVEALNQRNLPLLGAAASGWLVAGSLYTSRSILKAANHQYEIRELVIVLLITAWADGVLHPKASPETRT